MTISLSNHVCLSTRELKALWLLGEGLTTEEIAAKLYVSPSTVKGEFRVIVEKLHVPNRSAALAVALRRGWIE